MEELLQQIKPILLDRCQLRSDRLVVVGVSGGPDSLCLLELLQQAGYPVLAAHFNHRLRPESGLEAEQVHAIARQISVEFVSGAEDVGKYAEAHGLSTELAARELRYRFLFSEARARKAQAVAVGHTADDQVETVLMHFLRGSGLRGLGGMSHRTLLRTFDPTIPVVRPLLGTWHAMTEQYCELRGLKPLRDPSNASPDFLRNRVRNELLPLLEPYNARLRETVLRNAAALNSDQQVLDELMAPLWQRLVVLEGQGFVAIDLTGLLECSQGLQRQLIRRAAEFLVPFEQVDFAALDRALQFIGSPSARQSDFTAGLRLQRESEILYVSMAGADLPSQAWPQMPAGIDSLTVSIPGTASLAAGWELEVEAIQVDAPPHWNDRAALVRFEADLDASTLPAPLELRTRHPGDRIQPLGLGGHSQKISDFFVNEKVPTRARDRWPLLCAGQAVVWVPGVRLAEPFKVTPSTRQIAHCCVKPPRRETS